MSDVDALKSEIKKLSARAIAAKMNLHDLAEDLPINWTTITRRRARGSRSLCGARSGAQAA